MRGAGFGFLLVSCVYLALLFFTGKGEGVFESVALYVRLLPLLIIATAFSYVIRYIRWYWLLKRAGCNVPFMQGFLSYLAGFSFTATPGKVGELIRIRYFGDHGVPSSTTFAAFVFERSFDLIAVLVLSLLLVKNTEFLIPAILFVGLVVGAILMGMAWPDGLRLIERLLLKCRQSKIASIVSTARCGLVGCRLWLTFFDILVAFFLALTAWSIVACSFVLLQAELSEGVSVFESFSIYPLSMLIGAASMIPGGVGSTEGAIVLLLGRHGVEFQVGLHIAVGIRLTTLWFAILIGFLSMVFLEFRRKAIRVNG